MGMIDAKTLTSGTVERTKKRMNKEIRVLGQKVFHGGTADQCPHNETENVINGD